MSLIFLGMVVYVYILVVKCELWDEPIDYSKHKYPPENWNPKESYNTERKRRMESLMKWQMYKSDRFVLTGNIMYRVVITDLHEDKSYEIAFSQMIKFRKHWEKLNLKHKDSFLLAFIITQEGKPYIKAA